MTHWDDSKGKYREHYFSDRGDAGESWMWFDKDDSKTLHMRGHGVDAWGKKSNFHGWMKFVGNDTIDWEFTHMGMVMTGTNKRQ